MNIRIYTNVQKSEYAICCEGDQVMRSATAAGARYPELQGQYTICCEGDLEYIDKAIQEALKLRCDDIDNCCEDAEFVCCNCLKTIEKSEAHGEIVLYAGDEEIGMIAAYHNDCSEV